MEIQAGSDDGRGNLNHFKLLVKVKLSTYVLSGELELFEGYVAVFLQDLGRQYPKTFLVKTLEQG